jgi:hypothetical protein
LVRIPDRSTNRSTAKKKFSGLRIRLASDIARACFSPEEPGSNNLERPQRRRPKRRRAGHPREMNLKM